MPVIVVFPSSSVRVMVSTLMLPGAPSNSKVQTIFSGGTISRNSPRKAYSFPSASALTKRYLPPGRRSISQTGIVWPLGPHHSFMCSGLVIASNTSSRGASNVRVMTISVSEGVVTFRV